jgi:hypothetical protein
MNSRESRYSRQQKLIEELQVRVARAGVVEVSWRWREPQLTTCRRCGVDDPALQEEVRNLRSSEAAARAYMEAERQAAGNSQGQLEVRTAMDDRAR